jgi:four helix bundle protein
MPNSFRDLVVWQTAMALVAEVYKASDGWPKSEDYALKSQFRRAAVSIPSNIAEGSGRGTNKDFQYFLRIAKGSSRELETQIEIAKMVGYIDSKSSEDLQSRLTSVSKLLNRLIQSLDSVGQICENLATYEP